MVSCCLLLSATRVAPADLLDAFIAEDPRKSPLWRACKPNKNQAPPQCDRASILVLHVGWRRPSAAEEQPQQKDHRNRHTQHPKQKSSSHRFLLKMQSRRERAMSWPVPAQKTSQ